jgi:hypothetical protein
VVCLTADDRDQLQDTGFGCTRRSTRLRIECDDPFVEIGSLQRADEVVAFRAAVQQD